MAILDLASRFIKIILFVFNLLFVITGIILIVVGVSVKAYYHEYNTFLNNKYIYASDLLIVIGAIIFIVAFFGCCGAIKENACMTLTFSSLLFAIFILELIVGIGGFLLKNRTNEYLFETLETTMQEYNQTNATEITQLWDNIQRQFTCCGINSSDDWKNVTRLNNTIPMSCCEIPIGASGVAHCYSNSTNLHKEGCLTKFGDYIRGHAVTVEAVGIGFAIVQLLGMVCACYLSKATRRDYETV